MTQIIRKDFSNIHKGYWSIHIIGDVMALEAYTKAITQSFDGHYKLCRQESSEILMRYRHIFAANTNPFGYFRKILIKLDADEESCVTRVSMKIYFTEMFIIFSIGIIFFPFFMFRALVPIAISLPIVAAVCVLSFLWMSSLFYRYVSRKVNPEHW